VLIYLIKEKSGGDHRDHEEAERPVSQRTVTRLEIDPRLDGTEQTTSLLSGGRNGF